MSTRGSLTFSQDIRYESILSAHLGPPTDPRVCTTILSTPRDSALGPGSGLHHLLYIASSRMSDSHGNSYNRGLWMSFFISLTSLCKRWGMLGCFCFHSAHLRIVVQGHGSIDVQNPGHKGDPKGSYHQATSARTSVKTHDIFLGHLSCWYIIRVLFVDTDVWRSFKRMATSYNTKRWSKNKRPHELDYQCHICTSCSTCPSSINHKAI